MTGTTTDGLTEMMRHAAARLDRRWRSGFAPEGSLKALAKRGLAEVRDEPGSHWPRKEYRLPSTGTPAEAYVDRYEEWSLAQRDAWKDLARVEDHARHELRERMTALLATGGDLTSDAARAIAHEAFEEYRAVVIDWLNDYETESRRLAVEFLAFRAGKASE